MGELLKTVIRLIGFATLLMIGLYAINRAFAPKELGMFGFVHLFLLLLVGLITLVLLMLDITYYRINRRWWQFLPGGIGVAICIVVAVKSLQKMKLEQAPTLLQLNTPKETDANFNIYLKANRVVQVIEYHNLGQTMYYGTYQLNPDSSLSMKIDDANNDSLATYTDAQLRNDSVFWTNGDTMVVVKK